MAGTLSVRDSRDADVAAITSIYAHWVRRGFGSFEIAAPDEAEMSERRARLLAQGYPWLVAERAGRVCGYAYAGPYRSREAYRFACENSIYVSPDACGSGVGRALLSELIARCEGMGLRLMVAGIGDSGNAASIGLHAAHGFIHAGTLSNIGWKGGRWLDVVFMTRALGNGAATAPE